MSTAESRAARGESDPFGLQKRSVITIYRWSPLECCWSVEVASRAYWKGYLKLSLVSCPIALSPATSDTARVSFRQINKKTGNRLRYQHVDDETREPVESEDRGRGYEIDKGVYVPIEDEELEALQVESTHTIDIDSFVPAAQIDKRFYDSPYYIVPTDNVGQEAFAVIRDAMKGKGMVALGRIVLNKRERVIALEPYGKGIMATTLHYPYEVRKADEYFEDIADLKIPGEMLKLAEHILETKRADFDPSKFEDRYETAVIELLRKKQAGFKPPKGKETAAAPRNVINLMDALKASIKAEKKPAAGAKRSASARKRRSAYEAASQKRPPRRRPLVRDGHSGSPRRSGPGRLDRNGSGVLVPLRNRR